MITILMTLLQKPTARLKKCFQITKISKCSKHFSQKEVETIDVFRHKLIVEALMKFKRLSKAEIDVLLKNDCVEDLIQFKKETLKNALSPVRTKQVCDMEKALI